MPTVRSPARRRFVASAARLAAVVLAAPATVSADPVTGPPGGIVVIAHRDLRVSSIDEEEIRRLFLGESRRLPNGARVELASHAPTRSFFNARLLGLSDERVATLWSRLRFAGRMPPPQSFDTAEGVLDFVASTPDAIGYVPTSERRDDVLVLYSVPD